MARPSRSARRGICLGPPRAGTFAVRDRMLDGVALMDSFLAGGEHINRAPGVLIDKSDAPHRFADAPGCADVARGGAVFETNLGGGRQTLPMTTGLLATEAALGEAIFY
jgi:hypothetical protein